MCIINVYFYLLFLNPYVRRVIAAGESVLPT
jgi:hypothetical protein